MSQTSSWFSPHDHQRVLLNGRLDRPFRIQKMGGKGRVSFVLDRPFRIWKWVGKEGSHLSLPLPYLSYIRESPDLVSSSSVIVLSEL